MAKKGERMPLKTATEILDGIGIDIICERIASCEFLQTIADDYMVSRWALTKWLESEANNSLYACAREAQADKMAADILAIADDGLNDTYVVDGKSFTDHDVIARSRLRVDSRKWLAAKMGPKKYGEKLAVGGDADAPPIRHDVVLSPADAFLAMIGKK